MKKVNEVKIEEVKVVEVEVKKEEKLLRNDFNDYDERLESYSSLVGKSLFLFSKDFSVKHISVKLNTSYQHIRNNLISCLTNKTLKDIVLLKEDMNFEDIIKKLNKQYNK